jgi:hypothetical protein
LCGGICGNDCANQGLCCNRRSRQCVTCPAVCGGPCSVPGICAGFDTDCVCLGLTTTSNGTCGLCLEDGSPANAAAECCSDSICGGVCGPPCPAPSPPPAVAACTPAGESCQLDSECCDKSSCVHGKCGKKKGRCHNNRECAKGYRCVRKGSGSRHRSCRKAGSKKKH